MKDYLFQVEKVSNKEIKIQYMGDSEGSQEPDLIEAKVNMDVEWIDVTEQTNIDWTSTFPLENKPSVIGELVKNGTYGFSQSGTTLIPDNKGNHGKTAESYIPIDLSGCPSTESYSLTVNAAVSSEGSCDFGWVVVTDSSNATAYYSSTSITPNGNIIGTTSIKAGTYTIAHNVTLQGGKTYYLHFGYRKDGSVNSGSDQIAINSISLSGKLQTTVQHPKISIELEDPSIQGANIQYQINGTEEDGWIDLGNTNSIFEITENGETTYLTYGDTVYTKVTGNGIKEDYASITIEDGTEPEVTISTSNVLSDRVTVTVTKAIDNESGMPEVPVFNYYVAKSGEEYPETPYLANSTSNTCTIQGLDQTTGYKIKVTTQDKFGNVGESNESTITTGTVVAATGKITMTPAWVEGGISGVTITKGTSTDITNYTIQYQVNAYEESGWKDITSGTKATDVNVGDTVYARLKDEKGNTGSHTSLLIQDSTGPTITVSSSSSKSDSITITVTASDSTSGMPSTPRFDYYIAESGQSYSTTPTSANNTAKTYTFTGLKANTTYNIKIETRDKMGNLGTKTTSVKTQEVAAATGNITIAPVWNSTGISGVTITKGTSTDITNYTIQYQVNGTDETGWKDVATGTTVTDVTLGDTVYARLVDPSDNKGSYTSLTIQDNQGPTITLTNKSVSDDLTSITITVQATDEGSGMPSTPQYNYYIVANGNEFSATPTSASNTSNTYTFTGLTPETIYKIKVTTKDNFNNEEKLEVNIKTTTIIPGEPDENGVFTVASTINGETAGINNPKIPAGFKPLDAGTAVWGDGTSAPTQTAVNAGLVIQHGVDKSEYVWIPVEGIYTDADASAVATNSKVVLGRYEFDAYINTLGKAQKYTSTGCIEENSKDTASLKNYGNAIAKDIEGFISSVETNGGYYIARYEASKGANGRALSIVSQGYTIAKGDTAGQEDINVQENWLWNCITQPRAATACQNLYDGINSDLVNSYAWDTALLFIQKNSGNSDYSIDKSGNIYRSVLQNTGPREVKEDKVCNIYDMSGNVREWTTETCSNSDKPCTLRGGDYYYSTVSACYRGVLSTSSAASSISFRPLLYW